MRGKKGLSIVLLLAFAVVAVFIALAFRSSGLNARTTVATVDGEPIAYGELRLSLDSLRARRLSERAEGKSPEERWKREALDKAVAVKTEQILAKEQGLTADITYEAFLTLWERENKRRSEVSKAGQTVFGPVRYGEAEYFSIIHSELAGKSREAVGKKTAISEDDMLRYYEQNKAQYKLPDTLEIRKLFISSDNGETEEILERVRAAIEGGAGLDEAMSGYETIVKQTDQVFDAASARSDSLTYPALFQEAGTLREGEISRVFRDNEGDYALAICTKRTDAGYREYGEVKAAIRSFLAGRAYDERLDRLLRNAEIDVDEDVFARID